MWILILMSLFTDGAVHTTQFKYANEIQCSAALAIAHIPNGTLALCEPADINTP